MSICQKMISLLLILINSYEAPPIEIHDPSISTQDVGNPTFYDENSAVNWLVNTLQFDGTTAWSFINKMKWAHFSKTSHVKFEMNAAADPTWRTGLRKTAIVSARKQGNALVLRGFLVHAASSVHSYFVEIKKKKKKFAGITYGTKKKKIIQWRPLNAGEISQVYDRINNGVAATINQVSSWI